MCPACMATVALIVAGGTSAGGVTALVMKKLRRTRRTHSSTLGQSRPCSRATVEEVLELRDDHLPDSIDAASEPIFASKGDMRGRQAMLSEQRQLAGADHR